MKRSRDWGLSALVLSAAAASACTADLGAKGAADGGAFGAGSGSGDASAGEASSPREGDGTAAISDEGNLIADRALRRLAVREIEYTIDSLFPELAASRRRFPAEGFDVFDNDEGQNDAGLSFVENAALVMSSVVEQAQQNPTVWARVQTCEVAAPLSDCLGAFYDSWAPLVLRKDPDAQERAAFVGLSTLDLGTREQAMGVALEALLRHSEFLFRVELGVGVGVVRALTHREVLGRLSFFLWGEAPDSALLAAAASQDLSDDAVRESFARTMLNDPRTVRQVIDYHSQWFGFATMDRKGVGEDMWQESSALLARVVNEERAAYNDVLLRDESYLTPTLAAHYGLPALTEAGWVSVEGTGRAGLFGHGSFLSAFANVADTSPTKRGKNVQNRLLCRNIEIPTDLEVNVDVAPSEAECRQDFLAEVHAVGTCGGCHAALDGVGFGLDQFDKTGVFRESELGKENCRLDGRGDLDGVEFIGPAGLAQRLTEHEAFQVCVPTQLVRFYAGFDSRENKQAENWTATLASDFDPSSDGFLELMMAIVESPEFVFTAPQ